MIKLLKQYQVRLTPFIATKDQSLNNNDNTNLLLTETDIPIALEFIDYNDGNPFENSSCDIALEELDNNLAIINYGLNVSGIFYPNADPVNSDGTYQRCIYHQIQTTFYNTYLDQSKIWGIENIDFELSQTKKFLSDQFHLFSIPNNVFGDKILFNSITFTDNTLDNPYTITDDGNCNLFAGINLFSKQQELGEYINNFDPSVSSSYCDSFWNNILTTYLFDGVNYWNDMSEWNDILTVWED